MLHILSSNHDAMCLRTFEITFPAHHAIVFSKALVQLEREEGQGEGVGDTFERNRVGTAMSRNRENV